MARTVFAFSTEAGEELGPTPREKTSHSCGCGISGPPLTAVWQQELSFLTAIRFTLSNNYGYGALTSGCRLRPLQLIPEKPFRALGSKEGDWKPPLSPEMQGQFLSKSRKTKSIKGL